MLSDAFRGAWNLSNQWEGRCSIVLGIPDGRGDYDYNEVKLPRLHAFGVVKVDQDYVWVYNPHGNDDVQK